MDTTDTTKKRKAEGAAEQEKAKTKLAKSSKSSNEQSTDDSEKIGELASMKSSEMNSTSAPGGGLSEERAEKQGESSNEDDDKKLSQVDELLAKATLWDIVGTPDRISQLLVFYHDMTVEHAMHKLAEHKYLSAPVILTASLEDTSDSFGSFLGLVDTHNILEALIRAIRDAGFTLFDDETRRNSWKEALEKIGEKFHSQKLITICDFNDAKVVSSAELSMSLLDLVREGFLAPAEGAKQKHAHRLAVFSGAGAPLAVISQSDVVRYLTQNLGALGKLKDRHIGQLGFLKEVIETKDSELTIDAFSEMFDDNVAAIAVVDAKGKLVGNLSASDLRGLKCKDFVELLVPVKEFLKKRHEMDKTIPDHVISVSTDTTFEEALLMFQKHGVHRVYVTSGEGKPIGVVSLTDVLTLISMV